MIEPKSSTLLLDMKPARANFIYVHIFLYCILIVLYNHRAKLIDKTSGFSVEKKCSNPCLFRVGYINNIKLSY